MQLDIVWLALAAFAVSNATTVLTKVRLPAQAKVFVNLGLSAVGGAITTVLADGPPAGSIPWHQWFNSIVTVWAFSILAHHGFLKPTGANSYLETKTASIGIGNPTTNYGEN